MPVKEVVDYHLIAADCLDLSVAFPGACLDVGPHAMIVILHPVVV